MRLCKPYSHAFFSDYEISGPFLYPSRLIMWYYIKVGLDVCLSGVEVDSKEKELARNEKSECNFKNGNYRRSCCGLHAV